MKDNGFTLVELLSVIVIMGLLLIVAVPGVMGVSSSIKDSIYCRKVADLEYAAKLYGQDYADDLEEKGYIIVDVKTLIDNNMYKKERDDCIYNSLENPCVADPRNNSSMDSYKITILKKEKKFQAYFNFTSDHDLDICEGKDSNQQYGYYDIELKSDGATYHGSDKVKAQFGHDLPKITIPKKEYRVNMISTQVSYSKTQTVKFTFKGYFLTEGGETMYYNSSGNGTRIYKHTTDRVLYATWDNNSLELPTLKRDGYTFAGWWDKETGGTKVGKGGQRYTPSKDNITIYGQWSPINIGVTLNNQGAYYAGTTNVTATYDRPLPNITIPKKKYTITYNYNGNGQANSTVNSELIFGGYFNGAGTQYYNASGTSARNWNIASTTAELYAKWTNNSVTLQTPTRIGYTFGGWYTAASGGTKIGNGGTKYTVVNNITLYAHWNPVDYNITLNNQGATYAGTTSIIGRYSQALPSIDIPQRRYNVTFNNNGNGQPNYTIQSNRTFNGYYTAINGGGTKYINANGTSARNWDLTSNTTLYAYWTNGSIRLPLPARSGFVFQGWWTAPNSGGIKAGDAGANYTPTSNVTLYARWTKTYVNKGERVYEWGGVYNWRVLYTSGDNITLISEWIYGSWTETKEDGGTEVSRIRSAASYPIKNSSGIVRAFSVNVEKWQIEQYLGYGIGLNSTANDGLFRVGNFWVATNSTERYGGPYWIDGGGVVHYAYPYDGYVDSFGLRPVVTINRAYLEWDNANSNWYVI